MIPNEHRQAQSELNAACEAFPANAHPVKPLVFHRGGGWRRLYTPGPFSVPRSCAASVGFFSLYFSDLNFCPVLKISATCTQTPLPASCPRAFLAVTSSMKPSHGSDTDANETPRNAKESRTERTRPRTQRLCVRFFPFLSFHRPVEAPLESRCFTTGNALYLLSLYPLTGFFPICGMGVHPCSSFHIRTAKLGFSVPRWLCG
jgi:hypothetical protein